MIRIFYMFGEFYLLLILPRFANCLRAAGRLLELVVIPGIKHGSGMQPMMRCFKLEREAFRLAVQEYLVKED